MPGLASARLSRRVCEESNSLISDAIGVSYPIVDGIPQLVPKDGKLLETDDTLKPGSVGDSSVVNNELRRMSLKDLFQIVGRLFEVFGILVEI
ncbi:hypothetical protein HHK36_031178 [Tetracentron sinense]|uniref:Uncharacterized protein n=1 Tax=Tetracentron sinense TaxID=13715 RepID=A0A834YAH2_TETSI|nr:hypothetical protein HHK36_031178 [Tetracentron sinense]